jgi:hypothetical protein
VIVTVDVARLLEFTVSVDVPEPEMDVGLNVPDVFRGSVAVRFTVPVKPLIAPTVTVYVPFALRAIESVEGEAEMVKSAGAVTTSVTVVECVSVDPVPVMVITYVPAAVAAVVVTVMVELPVPATDPGEKLADAPVGSPLALNVTVSVKPPLGVIVAV